tara:strand:- start:10385 stop:10630 length:246 start_codon:yes stop_codon:yes gene_type:complete
MASYVKEEDVSAGGTFSMPYDGYLIIGANGGEVTVSITINGTAFAFDTTIADGKAKGLENKIPQNAVITITGAAAKVMAYA